MIVVVVVVVVLILALFVARDLGDVPPVFGDHAFAKHRVLVISRVVGGRRGHKCPRVVI